MTQQLKSIALSIVSSNSAEEEKNAAFALLDFISSINIPPLQPNALLKETSLQGGLALSPQHAFDCIADYARTARFIKGTYHAIQELLLKFPSGDINILYAGTGPFATILLPVLTLLPEDRIKVIFLDIHPYSIHSVKQILSLFELENFILDTVVSDAAVYQKPQNLVLHLIVSETMFKALTREPQVAITANLAPQLHTSGIFIPEEIQTHFVQTNFSKEHFFAGNESLNKISYTNPQSPKQQNTTPIFFLNKSANFSDRLLTGMFKSEWFPIPEIDENLPDLCIYTIVKIFGDLVLYSSESVITNPDCLLSMYNLNGNNFIKLTYNFKDFPHWEYELK